MSFRAFLVTKEENNFSRNVVDRQLSDLPDNEVLIDVKYSSLNYKDGLSATCLLYTSPSPRDVEESRMPSSA